MTLTAPAGQRNPFQMAQPSQKQINCIASFVEACGELEREPFFGKDEQLGTRSATAAKVWV